MHQKGVTLIELLTGLVLLSIIAGLAVPALNDLIAAQRSQDAAQQLASGLRMARAEAITRNQVMIVEPLDGDWSNGWRVFSDINQNGGRDSHEPVLAERAGYRGVMMTANGRGATIGFDSSGGPVSVGNRTLTVCVATRPASPHRVLLARSGRVRIERGTAGENRCGQESDGKPLGSQE